MAIAQFSFGQIVIQAETQTWSNGVIETIHSGYTGSGYVNTANSVGQWIEFSLVAPGDGVYDGYLTYANGGNSPRNADMFVNGVFYMGVTFYNSSWTNWDFLDFTVNNLHLNGGVNKIRFVSKSADGLANIDALGVNSLFGEESTYQAENQRWNNAVIETINSGYTGTGYVNTANAANVWIEFDVFSYEGGGYDMNMYYANGTTTNRPASIYVNGQFHTTKSFEPTGSWRTWDFTDVMVNPITLNAGKNTIRFVATTSGGIANFDKIELMGGVSLLKSDYNKLSTETNLIPTTLTVIVAPNVIQQNAVLSIEFPNKTNAVIKITSALATKETVVGKGIFEAGITTIGIDANDLSKGLNYVSVVTDSETITKTIIVK